MLWPRHATLLKLAWQLFVPRLLDMSWWQGQWSSWDQWQGAPWEASGSASAPAASSAGRPPAAEQGRPPKKQKSEPFFGPVADITKGSLVATVKAVQGANVLGDDLWKAWVEQFGQKFNDPTKYSSEFLFSFLEHAQSVQFTMTDFDRLQADIASGRVKQARADRVPLKLPAVPCPEDDDCRQEIRELYQSYGNKTAMDVDALLVKYSHALPELLAAVKKMYIKKGTAVVSTGTSTDPEVKSEAPACTTAVLVPASIPVSVVDPSGGIEKDIFFSAPKYEALSE
jgi:hypothetical protein